MDFSSILDSLSGTFGSTVTYSRSVGGVTTTAALNVVASKQTYDLEDHQGIFESHESRDYLVKASDFAALMPPVMGDTITEADGSVYEVNNLGGANCYTWPDPGKTLLKIHTKGI